MKKWNYKEKRNVKKLPSKLPGWSTSAAIDTTIVQRSLTKRNISVRLFC